MTDDIQHEIELYLQETFNALLEYEVRKCRRYKHPLSLLHIALQVEPDTPETRRAAEMTAINALDAALRDSDIPCLAGREFLVLLPMTNAQGACSACERLTPLLNVKDQVYEELSFRMSAFIGFTSSAEDATLSTVKLMEEAFRALDYACNTQSPTAISFSELK